MRLIKKSPKVKSALGITLFVVSLVAVVSLLIPEGFASAATPLPTPDPKPGSYGIEAHKDQPPPKKAPTITTPDNGNTFSSSPIDVAGLCSSGLFVQIFDNDVMVGATECTNGSFKLKVSLFTGKNVLQAFQYDDLYQVSPGSNKVTVSYNNSSITAFGELVTLTSPYGRLGTDPGSKLNWPLILSGGTGPYAFSIDWGDGKPAQLMSRSVAGKFSVDHVYDKSGIYYISIRVTDKNGVSAFLQLVAVVNGKAAANNGNNGTGHTIVIIKIIWIPAVIALLLIPVAYWLGRRSKEVSLRRRMEKDFDQYKEL